MVCLLDHDLKTLSDSSMSHSLTFAQAFMESSAAIEIWAHSSCDLDHPAVKRVFKLSQGTIDMRANRGRSPLLRKIHHVLMLLHANISYFLSLQRTRHATDAILFVANSNPFVVAGLQLFACCNSQVKIVVYFQKPVTRSVKFLAVNHRVFNLTNLRYGTEVSAMAEQYQSVLGVPCHVLPCPLPRPRHRKPVATTLMGRRVGVVLGQPRQAKGFDIFVEAIEHLARPLQDSLQLVVQSLPINEAEPLLRRCVERLSVLGEEYHHIDVITRALSRDEYYDLLSMCDFVVLPYRRECYAEQSSGIAFEALIYGKPLIVTEGLSFTAVARAHNALIEVPDGDPLALAEGIVRLIKELPTYRSSAARAAENLERVHSIDHLCAYLRSLFPGDKLCDVSRQGVKLN
jgi:glycosyltransferase involved in cell wall biosynthesis